MSKGPIIEGDNVTLKCHADGNPQPSAFFFHVKVSQSPNVNLQDHTQSLEYLGVVPDFWHMNICKGKESPHGICF